MALTNGTLFGVFNGSTIGFAWNVSNANNPNKVPANDLFQILAPGGACLLQVTPAAGAVNVNVAAGSFTKACAIRQLQMTAAQYAGLASPTSSTAAQIMAAMFPNNYSQSLAGQGQQLDIFQVVSDIEMNAIEGVGGGHGVIYRLKYDGSTATS